MVAELRASKETAFQTRLRICVPETSTHYSIGSEEHTQLLKYTRHNFNALHCAGCRT